MTDANRVRVSLVKETTLGVLPGTPRMRMLGVTGEGLNWTPKFFRSKTMRSDRQQTDPSKIAEENNGRLPWEMIYPQPLSGLSVQWESLAQSAWVETPSRDNDGTADSVITDIATVANTLTFTTGAAFVIGHLVQTSGFAEAANNTVVKVTTGGATSLVATGSGWTAQAVPPAAARVKVVGVEGVSADITATATGLASTTMNFVSMGIVAGMWLKVGGTAAGTKFATGANNGWARATVVSANAITLDNRPAGWGVDAGTGKTIRIFFGDYLRNGTTLISAAYERSFLGQATPTHILQLGMAVDTLSLNINDQDGITGEYTLVGMTGSQGTVANGNSYAAAPTGTTMTANASVGEIRFGGSPSGTPNWIKSLKFNFTNALRAKTAAGNVSAVDIGSGGNTITVEADTYFGSNALLAVAMAGTVQSLASRMQINSQAVVISIGRFTITDFTANATGEDTDVMANLKGEAGIDTVTNSQYQVDRLEYYET